VVIRKLSRAARDDKAIMLLPSEAETMVRFYKIATLRRGVVGAPELLAEFHRWMARDVHWRRDGGATVKAANSEVAEEWQVSSAMVQKVVREYGADAQGWLKKFGADRESTAVLIAMRAYGFRMLAADRKPTKFQAQIILYLYTVLSLVQESSKGGLPLPSPISPKAPPRAS
jgi:hypothetical protein